MVRGHARNRIFSQIQRNPIEEESEILDVPPEPGDIPPPAHPVAATIDISDEVTIPRTTFRDNPVENLPLPPSRIARMSASWQLRVRFCGSRGVGLMDPARVAFWEGWLRYSPYFGLRY